ncbi:MAG: FRG domain-containing protein [Caldilineaceae bacterium]|nr:FRG domain-containing protein [Caldilineaceae bacterium]
MSAQEPSITQDDKLEDVLEKIREIARIAARGNYIYRGEPEHYDKVSSGLYRQHSAIHGEDVDLEAAHEEMLKDAKKYTGQTDEFEILAFLQHFGGKTNLIDFTEDYLVALFFACGTPYDRDGRVILLPRQSDDGITSIKKPWSPRDRVIAQKSVFVQTKKGYLEPDEHINISKEFKRPTLDHLQQHHGITIEGIYNDLHGFIKQQTPISDPTLSPVRLTPDQEDLCRRLDELYQPYNLHVRPSDMFRGAVFVCRAECRNNSDSIAQAAHSLREILTPILRSRPGPGIGSAYIPDGMREAFERYGAASVDSGLMEDVGRVYSHLCDVAHHSRISTTVSDFEQIVADFERSMGRALTRQLDIHREIDVILSSGPPQ